MGFKGVKAVGLGYFVFSAFNFWNLMLLYNYLKIEIPTPVKVFMEKIFSQIIFHGLFAFFGVEEQVYGLIKYNVPEELPPSQDTWHAHLP